MEKKLKEKLLNTAYKAFVMEDTEEAIHHVFKEIAEAMNLSAVFVFRSGETPFLLEIMHVYEKEPVIGDRKLVIDYSENTDWFRLNPYSETVRTYCVGDISKADINEMTREMADSIGVKAFVACAMTEEKDYVGDVIFADRNGIREWKDDEISFMKEVTRILFRIIVREKRDEAEKYLLTDAENMASEANNSRDQFITNISHEIRTPMNSIIGMTSILRHNLDNPDVTQQCLERLDKAIKQLMDKVNDCVDMTFSSDENVLVDSQWFKPGELEDDIRTAYGPMCDVRNQILEFDYDSNMVMCADKTKLFRILGHLVANASKYSPDGSGIVVSIRRDESMASKSMVVFRVCDEGCGIDDKTKRAILDSYSSGAYTKGASRELGIFVAKHLITLLHGTMDIFSQKDRGTEFVFMIPAQSKGDKQVDKPVETDETSDEYSEMYIGRRILIAEDNVLMGEILATILGYRGLEADNAINGQEALDMYMSHDPFYYDMIFMDIQMPVMDGLEATKKIRESEQADAALIPIIALSANATDADVQKSLSNGMNAHLLKPVGEKELFTTIGKFMV